jgi:enoyl-CoA hydratase/carnithine racemase
MTEKLKFEVRSDKVAVITFNNPDKLNAFSVEMLEAYIGRLRECGERDDVRCVVVTGAGRGFCSGGDTGGMGGAQTTVTAVKSGLWDRIQKISQEIQALDKPVLAAVNGVAVGAGMDMALHCDIRYAAKSARFAETYVRMGLVPGNGACWFLPRIVGVQKALELLWTSKFVDSAEAKKLVLF